LNHNHVESILPKAKPLPAQARGKSSTNLTVVTASPDSCDAVLPNLEVLHLGLAAQQFVVFYDSVYVFLCRFFEVENFSHVMLLQNSV